MVFKKLVISVLLSADMKKIISVSVDKKIVFIGTGQYEKKCIGCTLISSNKSN